MKICGVDVCISGENNWNVTCKKCPHYVDADKIIQYLLDALEEEHTGLHDIYTNKLKEEFNYYKRGILNDE